jgi:hypothetical protein
MWKFFKYRLQKANKSFEQLADLSVPQVGLCCMEVDSFLVDLQQLFQWLEQSSIDWYRNLKSDDL